MEEALKPGYTLWELCEVEDRVGAERYFVAVMTRLKVVEGEDPLMPRWSVIAGSNQFWTEGPLSGEYLRGALHPTLAKQAFECSSEELVNRASKSIVWVSAISSIPLVFFPSFSLSSLFLLFAGASLYDCSHRPELEGDINKLLSLKTQRMRLEEEVGILRSSLDGARDDRAQLEGDVLSLTEAATLPEVKLKDKGVKVVVAFKASRGFKLGLEKMGRVSYEFGYQVALEQLRGKHPKNRDRARPIR
ncbi:hypothetical protein BHM03_00043063 [Ensete ventricosum]|nr:hypothetical protein BHM03_00043063 [Ensete ventricosum]